MLLGPGEGERVSERATIKCGFPELVVTEFDYAPGDEGPGLHIHRHHADAFWVLEGTIGVALGPDADEVELPAGAFVLIPPHVVHTFRNPAATRGRYLNLHAPGMGFDDYMRGGGDFDQADPPPDGGRPASEAIVVGPGEGESLELGASRASVKAGTDALTVVDIAMAPDFPHPPPHRHRSTVEGLYVLEGEPGLRVGDDEVTLAPGGCAFVPPGTVHASPPGGAPVRILNLFAPGGLVGLMREAAAGGAPDLGAYDIEFV